MAQKFLPLAGGLVTSRDPAGLDFEIGELTRADDAYYKVGDPGIWSVPGRNAFNSTPESGPIVGARYLEFDGAADRIVTHVGTTYRFATAGTTGTFANLATSITPGLTLDSVHYNNVHYLLNGAHRNIAVNSAGTTSFHGMLGAVASPSIVCDGGVGTGFTLTSGKTITYWVEERVKDSSGIVRRNATSAATQYIVLTGDGTLDKPVISRPSVVNSDATHWALYGTATNGAFPNGAEIAEVAIGVASIEDTRTGTDPGLPSGSTYQSLSVIVDTVVTNYPKNGPPPIANTGDIFEDSLVLNDMSDASIIRYSERDSPHAFPTPYFFRFETKEADEVKCIRTVGRSILVLMRDSIWRIDTLPRAEDSAFQGERVKEQIQGAQGCVGSQAACLFSWGDGVRLAYVSRYGLMVTDGFSWSVLTDDLDWENTVEVSQLGQAVLENDPRHYILAFYYTPKNGTANTKAIYLHYHPSHAKGDEGGFRAKITGPINVAAKAAVVVNTGGFHELFTANTNGVLYREWQGTTDDSGVGGIAFRVDTANVFLSGVGEQTLTRRLWLHHRASPSVSGNFTITRLEPGNDEAPTTRGVSLTRNEATSIYQQSQSEGMRLSLAVQNPLAQVGLNAFIVEMTDVNSTRI